MKPIAIIAVLTLCGCASLRCRSDIPEVISAHLAETGQTWTTVSTDNPMPPEFLGDLHPDYVFCSSAGVIRAYSYFESESHLNYRYREYNPANSSSDLR
jgi:hypothetical protein